MSIMYKVKREQLFSYLLSLCEAMKAYIMKSVRLSLVFQLKTSPSKKKLFRTNEVWGVSLSVKHQVKPHKTKQGPKTKALLAIRHPSLSWQQPTITYHKNRNSCKCGTHVCTLCCVPFWSFLRSSILDDASCRPTYSFVKKKRIKKSLPLFGISEAPEKRKKGD